MLYVIYSFLSPTLQGAVARLDASPSGIMQACAESIVFS